jgi:hypothetical protein
VRRAKSCQTQRDSAANDHSGGTNTREIVGNGIVLDDVAIEALYLSRELIGRAILVPGNPIPQHNGEA